MSKFLGGEWTHLFFIDDDIGFSGKTFTRMLTSDLDVVAAAAPFRSDEITYQGGFTVDKDDIGEVNADGFAPVRLVGAGFMCIKRWVLREMDRHYNRNTFFALSMTDGDLVEEDHAFCKRWQALRGTVHIDTLAELAHQGTKVFRRDFGAYLRGKP